jgi:hypothetical protein
MLALAHLFPCLTLLLFSLPPVILIKNTIVINPERRRIRTMILICSCTQRTKHEPSQEGKCSPEGLWQLGLHENLLSMASLYLTKPVPQEMVAGYDV